MSQSASALAAASSSSSNSTQQQLEKEPKQTLDGNEEVFENLLITLRTLQMQNKRLIDFQISSYKWHLQHHDNIKKIIKGLNMLGESFERYGIEGFNLTTTEDVDLRDKTIEIAHSLNIAPPNFLKGPEERRTNLHAKVVGFFKKSNVSAIEREAFERELKSIADIETFSTLKDDSFSTILPIISSWFKSIESIRPGLIYIHEGLRLYPKVFTKHSNLPALEQIVSCLEALSAEDFAVIDGFTFEELSMDYDILLKHITNFNLGLQEEEY